MKISYVGDFVNHGKSLSPTGTSLVFLLSKSENVDLIDVYCPHVNESIEPLNIPPKVNIYETYKYNSSVSLLKLLHLRKSNYDKIIFNMLSTSFGSSSITNAIGLIIPIIMSKFFRMQNIEIVYHNSVLTNDIDKLGYSSHYDRFRSRVLKIIEITIFKHVKTFVLLNIYKEIIDKSIGQNKVKYLNATYLEAFSTIFINGLEDKETIEIDKIEEAPKLLLHGNWGPQKNIELAIKTLHKIRKSGVKFNLTITGAINYHFPGYREHFFKVLEEYDFLMYYKGYISEKDIFDLFSDADLLLLPYNTPGGHSAVLEQAKLFEVPTVAIDFREYKEQAENSINIKLCSIGDFYAVVLNSLQNIRHAKKLKIQKKLNNCMENISKLLS